MLQPFYRIWTRSGLCGESHSNRHLVLLLKTSRSKKETQRLHGLTKPVRKTEVKDDLPPLDSDGDEDDEYDWSSDIEEDLEDGDASEDEDALSADDVSEPADDSDAEMPYETQPRKQQKWDPDEGKEIKGLPIKLADGKILQTGSKAVTTRAPSESPEPSSSEEEQDELPEQKVEDVSTGARFGKPAVVDVLKTSSRKAKIEGAKNQIASICQEILADPENCVGVSTPNILCRPADNLSFSSAFLDDCTLSLWKLLRHLPTQNLFQMTQLSEN